MTIWLDGERATRLPLPDRAMDFGDGLFETLLLKQGHPLFLELHLQRLQQGLQVLAFPDCLSRARDHLLQAAAEIVQLGHDWSVLRLTISRGAGPRGYAAPEPTIPRIVVSAVETPRDCACLPAAASLGLARIRWGSQPALARIKHLNRLEQVLAATQCREQGRDEALMLDQAGQVVSVSAGNLFVLREGQLFTPPLENCGVAGTRRRLVLERWAPEIGLAVHESHLTTADLEQADEVFYSSSVWGLRPVSSLGTANWSQHAVCEALFRQYRNDLP